MTKVAIVNAWGLSLLNASEENYDILARSIQDLLEREKDSRDESAAEVRVVATTADALKWVEGRGTIVYVTRGKSREAKRTAEGNPKLKVLVLTGLLPEGEVIFVPKRLLDHVSPAQVILSVE